MFLQSTCGWSMNFCAHLKVRSTSGSADCSLYFLSQPAVVWSSHGPNDLGWFPGLPKRSNLCPPANCTPQKLLASGIVENIWGWSNVRSNGPHSHKAHRSPEVLQGTSSRGFLMASEEPLFWHNKEPDQDWLYCKWALVQKIRIKSNTLLIYLLR